MAPRVLHPLAVVPGLDPGDHDGPQHALDLDVSPREDVRVYLAGAFVEDGEASEPGG